MVLADNIQYPCEARGSCPLGVIAAAEKTEPEPTKRERAEHLSWPQAIFYHTQYDDEKRVRPTPSLAEEGRRDAQSSGAPCAPGPRQDSTGILISR